MGKITNQELDSSIQIGNLSSLETEDKSSLIGAVNELNIKKVDKENGKGLSSNDYTTEEKNKLNSLGSASTKNTGIAEGNIPILTTGGKLDTAVIPTVAITDTYVVTSEAEMLALTAQIGDVAIRTDVKKSFILQNAPPSTLGNWKELLSGGGVESVNSKTGIVTLTYTDVGAEPAFTKNTAFNKDYNTSTANVKMDGNVAVGSQDLVARADHVHPSDTSREPVITTKNTAFNKNYGTNTTDVKMDGTTSVGSVDEIARIDHVHPTDTSRASNTDLALKAPLDSPALTGTPTAPTPAAGTNNTQIATTAFVMANAGGPKNKLDATTAPTKTDDTSAGYSIGSVWIDVTNDIYYRCVDATTGRAVWQSYTVATSTEIKRYGFRRERGNSDPTARITYLYDAVGLSPASMNFSTGNFDYGGWQTFVNDVSRPVMLKTDGTVDYELSRTDFTKKSDGVTASDVSNTAYAGNAMIEFRKFKWVYRYSDATYDYVIFSAEQYDSNYKAYAHTNANGTVKDAFYWGAFKGSNISSKLRSFADQTVMVSQTRNTEVSYATAIGSGYYTIYKSGWDFLGDLLTLISKSDDSQTKFGRGRHGTASALATGTLKEHPMFKGYNEETSDVKVFGIEGFWSNVWEGMAGLILNSGIEVKMTPPYNFDGTGYYATGITPSGTSGGYVSAAQALTEYGYIPSVASGSATTYYCDGLGFNNAQVDYALVGGGWDAGLLHGSRYVLLSFLASNTNTNTGSRLSYLDPA